DFKSGYGITIIPMNVANVRQIDRTAKQCFEIITPYRSFRSGSMTQTEFVLIVKLLILTGRPSISVIICKKCAGQHRSLGPRDSKVRSLKMDASVWTNELIELFIVIGNERSNSFWEGNLQPDEKLQVDAPDDKRLTFITQKYKEGKFRKITLLSKTKDELNKALCAAVIKPDVLETMMLLFNFSNCDGRTNTTSSPDSPLPSFLYDNLYMVSFNPSKLFINKRNPSLNIECNKRWCVLESGFLSYYENEKTATPSGTLDIGEVICLVIHKSEDTLPTERAFLFGAEAAHSQQNGLGPLLRGLQERETDVIGQLFYKDCQDLDNWKKGWFALEKTSLYFCLELENSQENSMYLRRLQELTISSCVQNGEKTDVLLLVEKGRTLYIRGHTKLDFTAWHSAIEKAARTNGNLLEDQQLSKNDVPIIVNSCIAFVTQYGLGSKHIYMKNGDPSYVRELLECFKKDARSVKLRAGTNRLEDVTDTLKSFLYTLDDKDRVRKYSTFIRTLPPKCSEINLMEPHNLAMAFSSCLFQTKGQTSEEVDVVEDLIVNYVQLFDISQAGDLLIDVYVERKEPDSSIIIRISPTMEAEELTRDVLGIKNLTPHKDDTWSTFEVIENGELGSKQSVNPSSPKINLEETSKDPVKAGYLKYKEEPSKLLSANKFQDRYFVLREGKLWLYKDMKSSKAEKAFPVRSLKLYLGVKKKLKPPTKYLCCDGQNSQLDWLNSIFMAQHKAMCPLSGKVRTPSVTKNPKIIGLPLIPIQRNQSIPRAKASLLENSKLETEQDLAEEKTSLKEQVSRVVQRKERKEEKAWDQERKHRSLICLEDMAEGVVNLDRRSCKESKSPRRNESKAKETQLEPEKQLPANVLHELHTVLLRTRALRDET
ncbi:hypothetical protein E2320_007964, partial [Naja naja]